MNKVFEFSSGQTKMLIALSLILVAVSVFRLVKLFSETGPAPLQLVVELSDGNNTYAPTLKVDLNLSPADSLELVPGIGPVLRALGRSHLPHSRRTALVSQPTRSASA